MVRTGNTKSRSEVGSGGFGLILAASGGTGPPVVLPGRMREPPNQRRIVIIRSRGKPMKLRSTLSLIGAAGLLLAATAAPVSATQIEQCSASSFDWDFNTDLAPGSDSKRHDFAMVEVKVSLEGRPRGLLGHVLAQLVQRRRPDVADQRQPDVRRPRHGHDQRQQPVRHAVGQDARVLRPDRPVQGRHALRR